MLSATRLAFRRAQAPAVARTALRAYASEATPTPKRPTGHATVEELHSQTAAEILAERDGGKSGTMRHFTVNFG